MLKKHGMGAFWEVHSTYNLMPLEQRDAYLADMGREIDIHLVDGVVAIRGLVEMWILHTK